MRLRNPSGADRAHGRARRRLAGVVGGKPAPPRAARRGAWPRVVIRAWFRHNLHYRHLRLCAHACARNGCARTYGLYHEPRLAIGGSAVESPPPACHPWQWCHPDPSAQPTLPQAWPRSGPWSSVAVCYAAVMVLAIPVMRSAISVPHCSLIAAGPLDRRPHNPRHRRQRPSGLTRGDRGITATACNARMADGTTSTRMRDQSRLMGGCNAAPAQ